MDTGERVTYDSVTIAATATGTNPANISVAAGGRRAHTAGRYWHYADEQPHPWSRALHPDGYVPPNAARHVERINMETGEVAVFNSITQAAAAIGRPDGVANISLACRDRRKFAYGYYWRYADD